MTPNPGYDRARLQRWAAVAAYEELHRELEARRDVGRVALPRWLRGTLAALGAIQLGVFVASLTIFAVFLVANLIFHLQLRLPV